MASKDWPQTDATVTSSTQHHCNLAAAGGYVGQEYSIVFKYQVNGRPYTGEFECSNPWEPGRTFCIHYDPADPSTNTMCSHKEERWVYYILAAVAVIAIAAYLWVASAHAH
jgi:hypothetical protein